MSSAVPSKPKNDDMSLPPPTNVGRYSRLKTMPWWLAAMVLIGVYAAWLITTNETYRDIFTYLQDGVIVTLRVSFFAYVIALIIGLIIGIARSYPPDENSGFLRVAGYHLATFYLEIFRGLPVLVVLLI
ncbi:MAG: hypothetical protein AAF125_27845, partial [Chloroflexota bacterium]